MKHIKYWHEENTTMMNEDGTDNDVDEDKMIENNEEKTKCTICTMRFRSPNELKNHVKLWHRNNEVKNNKETNSICHICNNKFKRPNELKNHIKFWHKNDENRRDDMKMEGEKVEEKTAHVGDGNDEAGDEEGDKMVWIDEDDNDTICQDCNMKFKLRGTLMKHIKYWHEENQKSADDGDEGDDDIMMDGDGTEDTMMNGDEKDDDADEDNMTENNEEETKCPICTMEFRCPKELKTHVKLGHRDNMDETKSICATCNNKFKRPNELKNHVRFWHKNTENNADDMKMECENVDM